MIFVLIVIIALLVLLLFYFLSQAKRDSYKTGVKESKDRLAKIRNQFNENALLNSIITDTAKALHKSNKESYERNQWYGFLIVFFMVVAAVVLVIWSLVGSAIWYIGIMYSTLLIIMSYIGYRTFLELLDSNFSNSLPSTYKYISSRYSISEKVLDSLEQAREDASPAVNKLLNDILGALRSTNAQDLPVEIRRLEELYDNRYATTLIMIAKHAYLSGGQEGVLEQLEELTEDVYFDTDNYRSVSGASKQYLLLGATLVPAGLFSIEYLATTGFADLVGDFYITPSGYLFKILILLAMLGYIGYIRYLEVKKVV